MYSMLVKIVQIVNDLSDDEQLEIGNNRLQSSSYATIV